MAKYRLPHEIVVPKNLDEALVQLKRMLGDELAVVAGMPDEGCMSAHHHGLGRWLRNNWGLWSDGPLVAWFNGLGIAHADDMSGIILTSLWREVHGIPLDIPGQVQVYREYWAKQPPEPEDIP